MDQWTPRVTARARLADVMRNRYEDRSRAAGLTSQDLDTIAREGRKAEEADRHQQEQLASMAAERAQNKELRESLFAREDSLRDRLPAIVGELVESRDRAEREQGLWLSKLSFARYRFRTLRPEAPSPEGDAGNAIIDEEFRAVERVQRTDTFSRARGLAAFCDALTRPGRELVLRRFAMRGIPASAFEELKKDARTLAEIGSNAKLRVEATAIEEEAAKQQRLAWSRVRRMMRKAVQGVPELEHLYAAC